MKLYSFFLIAIAAFLFIGCNDDDDNPEEVGNFLVARPIIMDQDLIDVTGIDEPRVAKESGKIYAYEDLIFVNEKYQGIHIIDNSNPANPVKRSFLKIPANVDISVKGDFLYADSLSDLVVFDISDINNINEVARLENVLPSYIVSPAADIFDWEGVSIDEGQVLVGWETTMEERKLSEVSTGGGVDLAEDAANTTSGQGGSLARFNIVGDHLYAVDSHNINIFGLQDLANPTSEGSVHAGFDIETIFSRDQTLFLGSMRGMYIYNIEEPTNPEFVSEFQHGKACDPVVVDGDYAYITLRSGNFCGATESGLYVVDISNLEAPELEVIYPLDEPYGLGVKNDHLFVCDGASGLKVFDKSNSPQLEQIDHFANIVTFDVIPLDGQLLMIGDGVLYQYRYIDNGIQAISELEL